MTQPIRPKGMEELAKKAHVTVSPAPDVDSVLKVVSEYDALITRTTKVGRPIIEKGSNLKAIAAHGTGVDLIDVEAASEHGIPVLHAPGANAQSVAEMVAAAMLALSRHLVSADQALRLERQYNKRDLFIGHDLAEKTVGIIGLGQIGKKVAQICSNGFNMKVLAFDPWLKEEHFAGLNANRAKSLDDMLSVSDFVTINCPLTKDTRDLIGKKELQKMKQSAYLINYARGPIVNKEAIIAALSNKQIAGAAFDIFWEEPPAKDCPFFELPNVLATPHIAAFSHESMDKMSLTIAQDVLRVLEGSRPLYMANPDVWK